MKQRIVTNACIILMLLLAVCVAWSIPHRSPLCTGGPQALPWLLMQNAGCPEARP